MLKERLDRYLLRTLQKLANPVPVHMGPSPEPSDGPSVPAIRLKDRHALVALLRNAQMNFGDLYSEGRLEIEGDMLTLLEQLYRVPPNRISQLASRCLSWLQTNSLNGSRKNIHHHYDISLDFYRLWLDPQLVYTCAYFPRENASLEEAQRAKMDLVCRKLWLRPGETVVEAGCGWGALALHMAKYYGVKVKAFNISHEQIAFARERARQEGLNSQVEFLEDDYRNIKGQFDVFVSVGMLEHIGLSHYRELGRVIRSAIGDRGRGFLHFIGRNRSQLLSPWIRKRIFPGARPPALREVMPIFEAHNFSVLDIENLRWHYARTLECWLENFERSYETVATRLGNNFARMWRLYLAGSVIAFRVGTMQLFQVVFAGSRCDSQPRTRAYLYNHLSGNKDFEWIHAAS
jgi:cyclopropane-fatty-acyl-phospholipid synthase